jgi:hypothetical protein
LISDALLSSEFLWSFCSLSVEAVGITGAPKKKPKRIFFNTPDALSATGILVNYSDKNL